MKRFVCFVLALFLLAYPVAALAASGDTVVYITRTGDHYHTAGCSYLNQSRIATTLQDAVDNGFLPCSRCDPPTLDSIVAPTPRPTATAKPTAKPTLAALATPAPQAAEPERATKSSAGTAAAVIAAAAAAYGLGRRRRNK